MNEWLKIVALNIKGLKDAREWSQETLAEKAGCSKSVVRDLESARSGASVEMLGKIANALGVSLDDLFKDRSRKVIDPELSMKIVALGEEEMKVLKLTIESLYKISQSRKSENSAGTK